MDRHRDQSVYRDDTDYRDDRLALEAILRAVPPEMLATLAMKETAKEAWDSIKTIRLGVDRVRKATAQSLRREFDDIRFKDGETVDEFALRLTGMMNNLALLGDDLKEERAVEKFLRVVPPRYAQVALSIETLLDLSELTVEELTGRLKAAEERYGLDGVAQGGSSLLFTHEEWMARQQKTDQAGATGGSSNQAAGGGGRRGGGGGGRSRGRGGGRGGRGNQSSSGSAARKNDKCHYYNDDTISGSNSCRSNSWRDDNDATIEIKVSRR